VKRFGFVALAIALSVGIVAANGSIHVRGAWSRPAIDTGVVYLSIANGSAMPDRLVAATSPVARAVELHESVETHGMAQPMNGMAGMGSMAGMVSMHPVRFVPIPADGTATLAPGGYHIMLVGLRHPLRAGERIPLRLDFAHAGWVRATAVVRAM